MHHERRAYLLPPYAAQSHLAAMIWFRAFTACGLGKEEWRPLVGMLCFRNQATNPVKPHSEAISRSQAPSVTIKNRTLCEGRGFHAPGWLRCGPTGATPFPPRPERRGSSGVLDGAEHHPILDPHDAPAPVGL